MFACEVGVSVTVGNGCDSPSVAGRHRLCQWLSSSGHHGSFLSIPRRHSCARSAGADACVSKGRAGSEGPLEGTGEGAVGAGEPGAAWLTMGAGLAENSFERQEEVRFRASLPGARGIGRIRAPGGNYLESGWLLVLSKVTWPVRWLAFMNKGLGFTSPSLCSQDLVTVVVSH